MKWLAECSVAALRRALGAVAPELSRYPATVPGPAGKQDPLWHSGCVPVGDQFFVKFAWSCPAALRLARETTRTLRQRLGTWIRPDQRRTVIRWCDWADAVLGSPGPAVLVHGDLHGDNQVWDRDELRLVLDFENIGAAEPEYELRGFPGPGMAHSASTPKRHPQLRLDRCIVSLPTPRIPSDPFQGKSLGTPDGCVILALRRRRSRDSPVVAAAIVVRWRLRAW